MRSLHSMKLTHGTGRSIAGYMDPFHPPAIGWVAKIYRLPGGRIACLAPSLNPKQLQSLLELELSWEWKHDDQVVPMTLSGCITDPQHLRDPRGWITIVDEGIAAAKFAGTGKLAWFEKWWLANRDGQNGAFVATPVLAADPASESEPASSQQARSKRRHMRLAGEPLSDQSMADSTTDQPSPSAIRRVNHAYRRAQERQLQRPGLHWNQAFRKPQTGLGQEISIRTRASILQHPHGRCRCNATKGEIVEDSDSAEASSIERLFQANHANRGQPSQPGQPSQRVKPSQPGLDAELSEKRSGRREDCESTPNAGLAMAQRS